MPLDEPAAGDRRHARRGSTRRAGVTRAARRAAGARRRGQRRAVLAAAAARHAAGRPARGRARAAGRLPALGARVGAARADRARHRLVGARAVRCCGVPLNPMSATLGALVIAISTEFAVLLTARYREERAAGLEPRDALRRTYRSTGAAVLASGATAIAGFAVLALSDVQMLLGLRPRHRRRPVGLAARRARRAAGGADAGRAARARRAPAAAGAGGAGAGRPGVSGPAAAAARGDVALHVDRRRRWRCSRSPTSRSTRSAPTRPGSRGVPNGRASCRRSRCRSRLSNARGRRAGRPGARRARVRGPRTSSTPASWPSAARSCSRSSPTRSKRCERQIDVLERRAPALPGRRLRGRVGARRPRATCAPLVRERGWGMPVGYDHDGAVTNAYAVAICPTITFARARRRGGGHVVRAARRGARWRARRARRCGERRLARRPDRPGARRRVPGAARCAARRSRRAPGRSPPELRERLRVLSDRFRGAAGDRAARAQPIPHAYRVFFRHIGLDPDEHRTPVEALALERLKAGGFRSRSAARRRADDRGDGDRRAGVGARRRPARGRARAAPARRAASASAAASTRPTCPPGGCCVADDAGPVGVLFGALAPGRGVGPETTRMTLLALQVAGVPDIHVEEALWTVADILGEAGLTRGAEPERVARWTTRSRSTPRRCGRPATAWSTCWSSASPACASGPRSRAPRRPRCASGCTGRRRTAGTDFDAMLATLERDVLAVHGPRRPPRATSRSSPASSTWPGALGDFIASALNIYAGLVDGVGGAEPGRAARCSTGSRTGSATRPRRRGSWSAAARPPT